MTRTFYLLAETDHARRYTTDPRKAARAFWVPRSVCRRTLKFPQPEEVHGYRLWRHEVEIEDWWWDKHLEPVESRGTKAEGQTAGH